MQIRRDILDEMVANGFFEGTSLEKEGESLALIGNNEGYGDSYSLNISPEDAVLLIDKFKTKGNRQALLFDANKNPFDGVDEQFLFDDQLLAIARNLVFTEENPKRRSVDKSFKSIVDTFPEGTFTTFDISRQDVANFYLAKEQPVSVQDKIIAFIFAQVAELIHTNPACHIHVPKIGGGDTANGVRFTHAQLSLFSGTNFGFIQPDDANAAYYVINQNFFEGYLNNAQATTIWDQDLISAVGFKDSYNALFGKKTSTTPYFYLSNQEKEKILSALMHQSIAQDELRSTMREALSYAESGEELPAPVSNDIRIFYDLLIGLAHEVAPENPNSFFDVVNQWIAAEDEAERSENALGAFDTVFIAIVTALFSLRHKMPSIDKSQMASLYGSYVERLRESYRVCMLTEKLAPSIVDALVAREELDSLKAGTAFNDYRVSDDRRAFIKGQVYTPGYIDKSEFAVQAGESLNDTLVRIQADHLEAEIELDQITGEDFIELYHADDLMNNKLDGVLPRLQQIAILREAALRPYPLTADQIEAIAQRVAGQSLFNNEVLNLNVGGDLFAFEKSLEPLIAEVQGECRIAPALWERMVLEKAREIMRSNLVHLHSDGKNNYIPIPDDVVQAVMEFEARYGAVARMWADSIPDAVLTYARERVYLENPDGPSVVPEDDTLRWDIIEALADKQKAERLKQHLIYDRTRLTGHFSAGDYALDAGTNLRIERNAVDRGMQLVETSEYLESLRLGTSALHTEISELQRKVALHELIVMLKIEVHHGLYGESSGSDELKQISEARRKNITDFEISDLELEMDQLFTQKHKLARGRELIVDILLSREKFVALLDGKNFTEDERRDYWKQEVEKLNFTDALGEFRIDKGVSQGLWLTIIEDKFIEARRQESEMRKIRSVFADFTVAEANVQRRIQGEPLLSAEEVDIVRQDADRQNLSPGSRVYGALYGEESIGAWSVRLREEVDLRSHQLSWLEKGREWALKSDLFDNEIRYMMNGWGSRDADVFEAELNAKLDSTREVYAGSIKDFSPELQPTGSFFELWAHEMELQAYRYEEHLGHIKAIRTGWFELLKVQRDWMAFQRAPTGINEWKLDYTDADLLKRAWAGNLLTIPTSLATPEAYPLPSELLIPARGDMRVDTYHDLIDRRMKGALQLAQSARDAWMQKYKSRLEDLVKKFAGEVEMPRTMSPEVFRDARQYAVEGANPNGHIPRPSKVLQLYLWSLVRTNQDVPDPPKPPTGGGGGNIGARLLEDPLHGLDLDVCDTTEEVVVPVTLDELIDRLGVEKKYLFGSQVLDSTSLLRDIRTRLEVLDSYWAYEVLTSLDRAEYFMDAVVSVSGSQYLSIRRDAIIVDALSDGLSRSVSSSHGLHVALDLVKRIPDALTRNGVERERAERYRVAAETRMREAEIRREDPREAVRRAAGGH